MSAFGGIADIKHPPAPFNIGAAERKARQCMPWRCARRSSPRRIIRVTLPERAKNT